MMGGFTTGGGTTGGGTTGGFTEVGAAPFRSMRNDPSGCGEITNTVFGTAPICA